jgi:hypothetical protein
VNGDCCTPERVCKSVTGAPICCPPGQICTANGVCG